MKVVINDGVGSYGLSEMAYNYLKLNWQDEVVAPLERVDPGISREHDLFGLAYYNDRSNPALVEVVGKLGIEAGWKRSHLKIVNVSDHRKYYIYVDSTGWESVKYLDEEINIGG